MALIDADGNIIWNTGNTSGQKNAYAPYATTTYSNPYSTSTTTGNAATTGYDVYGGYSWKELAVQQALAEAELAYKYEYMRTQDKQAAAQLAEQAATRKLNEMIALGYITSDTGATSPTLERQMQEGALQLNQLNYLNSLSGPQNWIKYANAQRALNINSAIPAWAQAVAQGKTLSGYTTGNAGAGNNYSSIWSQPGSGNEQYASIMPYNTSNTKWTPSTATSSSSAANTLSSLPTFTPNQISVVQWNNMTPSERAMLQGAVEYQGGNWDDFQDQLAKQAPRGTAVGSSSFRPF